MEAVSNFPPEKLIIGVLFSLEKHFRPLSDKLIAHFGPIDYTSEIMPFTFSPYYEKEMGSGLKKVFYSFKNLVNPENLADIKLRTNDIESHLSLEKRRTVNIDPGILNFNRLILATTKDQSHRIPLKKGIYGELTLKFQKGDFHCLPWTYSDFQSREYRDILISVRNLYKIQLKNSDME